MNRDRSLKILRQATVFVAKEGGTKLAYWLDYEVGGKAKSMAVVLEPHRCLFPRDKLALGFEEQVFDVSLAQLEPWLRGRGYRLVGPMMEPAA